MEDPQVPDWDFLGVAEDLVKLMMMRRKRRWWLWLTVPTWEKPSVHSRNSDQVSLVRESGFKQRVKGQTDIFASHVYGN